MNDKTHARSLLQVLVTFGVGAGLALSLGACSAGDDDSATPTGGGAVGGTAAGGSGATGNGQNPSGGSFATGGTTATNGTGGTGAVDTPPPPKRSSKARFKRPSRRIATSGRPIR